MTNYQNSSLARDAEALNAHIANLIASAPAFTTEQQEMLASALGVTD